MKRLIITAIIAAQALCLPQTAMAEPEASVSDAQEHLNDTNTRIDELKERQEELQKEADELDIELVAIMIEIETTKADIEDKNIEIDEAKEKLKEAEDNEEEHRESMEVRIQYIYENGNIGFLTSILTSGSFANVLNRAEFTNSLYKEDRSLLDEYTDAKEAADAAREKVEEEKSELEELKDTLKEQKDELEAQLTEKTCEIDDAEGSISDLEDLAKEYQGTIDDLNAEIKAQEELEAAKAAAESISTANLAAADEGVKEEETPIVKEAKETSAAAVEQKADDNGGIIEKYPDGEDSSVYTDDVYMDAAAGALGQAVADYACQFVGNPYVWGGTSLTNGCDCSGFIMSVYAHFGVSLPHYSGALRSVGYEVSEEELAPGDIICFSGHCAIYIGNNQIVHAQSSSTGIVISSYPYHKTTLARRRIF